MKQYILISVVILFSCREEILKSNSEYLDAIEDHETTPYNFPTGYYYYFDFSKIALAEFDIDKVVEQIKHNGVYLQDLWYKKQNSMCIAPGSNIGLTYIVQPELIIRVVSRDSILNDFGFYEIDTPKIANCAYKVFHYKYY